MNTVIFKRSSAKVVQEALIAMSLCIPVGGIALLMYGRGYGERFFARTKSLTTAVQIRQAVGDPMSICTNRDGTVMWDYTHWWSATAKVYLYTNGDLYRIFTE